ncbi:MAG: hypothetical protein ACJAWV_001683 [Flammeovirgaceae bacterium]|jgi:uncharacterized protein YqjF (DUF2071 family)
MPTPIFLSAKWEHLIMANYPVSESVLLPYLPKGTELDLWEGKPYVSVVGFMFLDTKVMGIKIPFHINFEELNLRFYVRRFEDGEWKRGVVFVREIVPKYAIAFVAKWVYNEQYSAIPMRHEIKEVGGDLSVKYDWKLKGKWNSVSVIASSQPEEMKEGSEEEFIAEHYWGYAKQKNNSTQSYEVEHPKWEHFPVKSYEIQADFTKMYGAEFVPFLEKEPTSVFLAKGSEVNVRKGVLL